MVDRVEAILAAEERSREQMARQFDSFSNAVSCWNFYKLHLLKAVPIVQIPTTESSRSKLKQKLKTKAKKSSSPSKPKVKSGAKTKTAKTENRRRGTFSSPRSTSAFLSRHAYNQSSFLVPMKLLL